MNTFRFGDPNLFVKGMVEAVIHDPTTGNIVGYDNVSTDNATTTSMNIGAIEGGLHQALIINIPDTSRLSGTLTSQAFSLEQRGHIFGTSVSGNGIIPVCETVVASSTSISVSGSPVKSYSQPASDTYGWCYVRVHGASDWYGTNYNVNLSTGEIVDFTATSGVSYDVQYFQENGVAKVLPIPTNMIPDVLSLTLKYAVYSKGTDGSVVNGTLAGYLFEVIPRVQFTGDGGVSGNQTTNSTTDYSWTALAPDMGDAMPNCVACENASGNYAYFVWCPCNPMQSIKGFAIAGGSTVYFPLGASTVKVPVVYILDDGSIVSAPWSDFHLEEMDPVLTADKQGNVDVSGATQVGIYSSGFLENDLGINSYNHLAEGVSEQIAFAAYDQT